MKIFGAFVFAVIVFAVFWYCSNSNTNINNSIDCTNRNIYDFDDTTVLAESNISEKLGEKVNVDVVPIKKISESTGAKVKVTTAHRRPTAVQTDIEVESVVSAALASGSRLQIQAVLSALVADRAEAEVQGMLRRSMVNVYPISVFDVLDGGEFYYLVRELRSAIIDGDVEREREIKEVIVKILFEPEMPDREDEIIE